MTVADELARWHHKKPLDTALSLPDGRKRTWADLDLNTNQVANALSDVGCGPGSMVTILASNSIEYVEAFVGALKSGSCVVPLPTGVTAEALHLMLDECAPKAIFVDDHHAGVIRDWLRSTTTSGHTPMIQLEGDTGAWVDFMESASAASPNIKIRPDMWFNIIYSSGTTGRPKGIVHTHGCRQAHIDAVKSMGSRGTPSIGPDSVLLLSTALYSNTTLVPLIVGLATGAESVIMEEYDTRSFLETCESRRPSHVLMVPVQIARVLDHPDFDSFDLGTSAVKITSSAKLTAGRKQELVMRWPGGLIDGYGQTEGGPATCWISGRDEEKPDSVGRTVGDCEIRILNSEGEALPNGEIGEIVGYSSTMMWGYYKLPELTEHQKWTDEQGREFLRTSDVGKLDDDGYLYILDRSMDVIISGGFNIYATDLEEVVLQHPDIVDVAVIGVPSDRWGETPMAVVVLVNDCRIDHEELLSWVNDRLGKIQRISRVEVCEEIPRSSIGKILKRELRSLYKEPGQPES